MGFFDRFSANREGPGVEKDAPPKHPLKVFFGVYTRKFYKLLQLNLIHFLCSFPAVITALVISGNFLGSLLKSKNYPVSIWLSFAAFICVFNVIAVGPFQSGFTYVLRNFSREEHAFVWHDYIKIAKKNLKQSLIMTFINLGVFAAFSASFSWYLGQSEKSIFLNIAVGVQGLFLIIFLMMQIYTYQIMITFELKLMDIYKNALLFAIAMFMPNFLILLLCGLFSLLLMTHIVLALILLPTFTLSVMGLIVNFYANRVIKKHMIDIQNK
jgi:uncharacterized membrane protein YesL